MANVIEVEAGGKVFEFPADTSRDVMLRALRQHFGFQEPAAQPTITQPPVTPQPATLPQDFQIPVEAPPSVIPPVTQEEPLLPPEASIEQFVRGRPAEATAYTPTMLQRIAELLPGDKARSLNEYIARQIARERKIPITQVYEEIGGARPIFNPEGRAPVTAGIEAAGVIAKEIPEIPAGVGTAFLRAYRAGEMPVVDESWVDKAIAAMDPMKDGKPDPNYSAFQGLGQSLGFSIASMVASITAGAGATTVTGGNPAAGVAAGMATSGTLAYRASKDEFLDRVRDKLNKQSKQLYGKPLSAEDWKAATEEFDSAATRYGLWEAIPEAVSNAIFLKAFSSPARGLSANRLAEVGNKAGALAAEQATETITALGQNAEERKAGLTNEELSIVGAFRQQFIQTLLISGTMAGGMKGKQLATDFYQNYVEPRIDPASALGRAIQADLESVGFSAAGIDQAARASLATDQSLASRTRAEATIQRMRQLAVPPAEEPPAEEPGERVEPTIGEIPAPGGRAEPAIGELPPSEGVEPGLGEPAAPAAAPTAPTAPAAPAGIGMPDVEDANIQTIQADETRAASTGAIPAITTTPPAEAVTTEETKPAPAAVVENSATEGIPIVYPLVSSLKLSNDVPQFKEDADQKGVVNRLTGKFDWRDFGAIQVWQRLNGDLEVISGRHRLDLAQRSGIERVPAQIYREADGFTAQDAAILDAELNIRDEKGTVKDYVQYFKGSGITQDEAQSRGLLDNVKGTRAFAIANFGSPELVAAHSARQLSDEAAAQIALAAPQDSRLQAVGLKVRQDGKSDEAAVNAVRAVKAIAREQNTTTDMFGFDDSLIKEAVEMAKIAERKQKELSNRIAVLSKVSKNPKIAEQEGIDIKDPKAVANRIQELKDLRAAWNNWETNPDLINEIRQERGAFELTAETEEQRAAREAEEEASRRAEAEAAAEAERKAKADRERGEFVLTGSDRPTDEAEARGQEALFGAPAEPAQGDVVASQDLPDNMQARVVKTSDGYASLLFDKDSNNVVNGSVTRFTGEDALSRATTSFNDLAAKATPAEPRTAPEAIEEVVEPIVEQAPVAQNLAEAQAAYDKALDALNAHGSAPPKPSSEKKYFGERGRAGASPEEVAKYDAQVKAYNAWKRKYNKLKKAEVDAANNLERARQADQDAKNGAASPDQAINESQAIDTTVKVQLEAMAKDFMVGDQVRFGNMPGVVIGLEGDSVRFRPDAARSPKAYQKVPKSSLTFVSRPDTTSQVSYSKEQDNKFGDEAGALNADKSGLIQLLGANMYQSALADVAIKELLQNAFDAVKGAASTVNSQGNKITPLYKEGKIEVEIDSENRTITIRDNARGMTPEIVRNAFFTIAGSDKSDLPPELRSGGFGFAKMGFMLGSESLKLDTVRDGVRVTVDTTAKDIAADNFTIKKAPAPKGEHGTSITVKIPDKYLDRNGEAKDIYFPYSLEYIEPLNKPLIGPVEVTATLKAFGNKETKVLPIGVNFPKDKFTKFKANFDWGSADIYFSIDRNAGKGWNIKHQVLSSGVYQFNPEFMLNNEKIPYDIIVDVKPNVTARDPNYPFENSRERFKGRLKKDIDALTLYLGQIARGYEARDLQESFKGVVSMPRIEAGAEIAGTAEKLKKSFGVQGAAKPAELKPLPKEVTVTADAVQDTVTQKVLVDVKAKEAEKQKEATFKAEKAPKSTDFMIELKQDPKLPVFHNNTNVDFVEIGRAYGEPEKFFAELGTLMVEMKEDLAKSGFYGYDKLSPDNLFFAGVSIDKQYGGVHIRVPYKALFVNPFYEWGARTLFGVRQNLLNTMIHEIAHTGDMDHGEVHNGQIIKVEQYLADEGLLDYYRDALLDLLRRHESTFTAMKEAYGKSTTRNTAKSLKDYGKDAAAASTRGAGDGRQDQAGAVPAGGRPGRGEGVPGAAASRAEEEPTGTGEARREQVDALLQEFDRPEVPSRDTKLAQRTLLPSGSKLKQFYSGLATSNGRAADGLIGPLHRGMAAIRNKLFFSGAALEEADARRYGRMVVTPNDLATATLAVDNMLHGGGIAVEFIARGGIEYNPQTKRIQAVQAPTSMMDVYRAEKSLKDELGTKRAEGLINGYLEAKRSRSIRDEMESLGQDIQTVEADLQTADNDLQTLLQNPASTKQAINAKTKQVDQLKQKLDGLRTQLDDITQINDEKVLMDDAEIDAFIAQENDFPQLRQIMDAWTDTNRRLLGMMRQVRLISQDRYDRLVNIKDYVPWQRVMDDEGDIHGPAPSRSVTRIPKERVFKRGKVERPVEYIIDNMTNNIIRLTMNSLRQYAAGRIVSEYATRNEKGQIKTFPKEDRDKNRFPYIIDGRRTIVEIKDPLIAEAVYGSDSVDLRMNAALAAATNFMRRVITVDPFFQAAQVVKDAPTAAIVTGVKNPVALMSRVMTSFAGTVLNTDPVADILKANGIGGFQSIARTPEKRLKQKIGIATMSVPEATMALLDHIGDASDFAARIAAYKQVMKETGNEAEALNRAANVINFNRLGSSRIVRQFIRYVNFANAYLQSIDTLVTALTGRGMRGRNTKAALAVAANAMIQLTGLSLLYSFLVGGDDEYQKLDDQTKARNFFIPSTITKQLGLEKGILIPMNTSAAFFFKALPELTYQAFVNSATKSDFDATRYRKAVAEAAADALLGPEPVPSAIRPIVEIGMNRSFFTEKSLTPRGMETLEKSRQFTDATSEIAKQLGEFGGLSPIEWDHLIRGTTGVAGMMVQQASNMIGEYLNTRPETPAEKLPGIGRFIAPEEGRGREALFYDLHERIRKATSTLKDLEETGEFEKAEKYEKEKESLLGLSVWSNRTEARLKKINEEIRLLSRGKEEGTARARRRTIRELQREKNERLEGIEEIRAKEAGL